MQGVSIDVALVVSLDWGQTRGSNEIEPVVFLELELIHLERRRLSLVMVHSTNDEPELSVFVSNGGWHDLLPLSLGHLVGPSATGDLEGCGLVIEDPLEVEALDALVVVQESVTSDLVVVSIVAGAVEESQRVAVRDSD